MLKNIINPIAKAIAISRRKYATKVVKPKKGKGSYDRKKDKADVKPK
jgi:stalled ribosome alternative rescue factor ArfA|tara:strand:- start:254 stop:394 length:141 start_codon:yes stop_codon:yes gene_type:complete